LTGRRLAAVVNDFALKEVSSQDRPRSRHPVVASAEADALPRRVVRVELGKQIAGRILPAFDDSAAVQSLDPATRTQIGWITTKV